MSRALLERALACSLVFALSSCSFGLFQTAHTAPPGRIRGSAGLSYVTNSVVTRPSQPNPLLNLGAEAALRVGLTQHLDIGVGSFELAGAALDAKYNLLRPDQDFALAPRAGVAYGFNYETFRAEVGGVVSYRLSRLVEPYLGLTFANYWIGDYTPPDAPAPPGWHFARRKGTGDGVLELNVGVELPSKHFATLLEYGHWFVLQDDPGDFYHFVPTNIVGVAVRF